MASNDEQVSYHRGYTRGYATGQKNVSKYMDRAHQAEAALRQIAAMDAEARRADDLGRAARIAREALAAAPSVPVPVPPGECLSPNCECKPGQCYQREPATFTPTPDAQVNPQPSTGALPTHGGQKP
jgi:hypothetical protein